MTKVTCKCKRSGNTVSFDNEHDIEGLRKHEGYDEVINAQAAETVKTESPEAPTEEVLKPRMGRPRKIPAFLQE